MSYWYVVIDDTPICPEQPLSLDEVIDSFRMFAEEPNDGETIEVLQCTPDDLEWAGVAGSATSTQEET